MYKFILISFLALLICTGCTPEVSAIGGEAGPPSDNDLANTVSEQRLEKLSEVVRDLRDRDANMMFPNEEDFRAAVRRKYPAEDLQNDVMLDGWGNPFVYARYGDNRIYRLHSMGPNGSDEHGTGDDSPTRGGSTEIE